jgi:hypothetical protein
MKQHDAIVDIVSNLVGPKNIVIYQRDFSIKLGRDIHSALMLSQIIYWHGIYKKKGKEWFYKTDSSWMEELDFSEKELRRSKLKLKSVGLIETCVKKAGESTAVHYKINTENLSKFLSANCPAGNSRIAPRSVPYIQRLDSETLESIKPIFVRPIRPTKIDVPSESNFKLFNQVKDNPSNMETEGIACAFLEEFELRRGTPHVPISNEQMIKGLAVIEEHMADFDNDMMYNVIDQHFNKKKFKDNPICDFSWYLFIRGVPIYVSGRFR